MTITVEYDESEEKEHKLVSDSNHLLCLRHMHLMPSFVLAISGCLIGGMSCFILLLRDIEYNNMVMLRSSDLAEHGRSSRVLIIWLFIGIGAVVVSIVHFLLCLAVLQFRRPDTRLATFLQALNAQQQNGESRDPSLFNSNQHFRRFPPRSASGDRGVSFPMS